MQLPAYDVILILRDPDDHETQIKATLERVPREKVLTTKLPMANTLEMFEQVVEKKENK